MFIKKFVIILFFSFFIYLSFSFLIVGNQVIIDDCYYAQVKTKLRKFLVPYQHETTQKTIITFENKKQVKEIEVPLFSSQKYRFIFSREGMYKNVQIEIYDKSNLQTNRKLLYTSKEKKPNQKEFIFDIEKQKKIFINYVVPEVKTNDTIRRGCMVFSMGFLMN